MNIEHSRGSAELEYIPDNDGLDKFDSETAGLVPVIVQPLPVRMMPSQIDSGDLPLYAIEGTEIADAATAFDRKSAGSRPAPRVAGTVLKAALASGLLVMGMIMLPTPVAWRSSPPSLLEARHAAVETLALAAPPTIPTSAGSGMNNVPVVYRKPSVAPAGPAGNRLQDHRNPGRRGYPDDQGCVRTPVEPEPAVRALRRAGAVRGSRDGPL